MKVSFGGIFSADELSEKINPIGRNWSVLQAGNDVTDAPFIIDRARFLLKRVVSPTPSQAAGSIDRAYKERLQQQIESQVLAKYGLSLPAFLKDGKRRLTERTFNSIFDKIGLVQLSMEFLVVGFDLSGEGHILYIDGVHKPASYDDFGFCAIGSGSDSAHAALAFHANQNHFGSHLDLTQSVYCACSAKFMAEFASDVGKHTFLTIHKPDAETQFISDLRIDDEIRKAWETHGAPRVPSRIVEAIPSMAYTARDCDDPAAYDRIFGKPKGPKGECPVDRRK
jgi:hypothetical protein